MTTNQTIVMPREMTFFNAALRISKNGHGLHVEWCTELLGAARSGEIPVHEYLNGDTSPWTTSTAKTSDIQKYLIAEHGCDLLYLVKETAVINTSREAPLLDFKHISGNAVPEVEAQLPAPVAQTLAEPDKAGSASKRWVMKKAALIDKHCGRWPTIKRDFQDASENGLTATAKAPGHGEWFEADALKWAEQRGKLTMPDHQTTSVPATPFTGLTHKMKG